MSSHLYLPEPEWLAGPTEPSPRFYSGTCPHCLTQHFNGPGEGLGDLTACSCGDAQCCSECDRCSQCGDHVCPQCSVDFATRSGKQLVCAGCHQVYLDDLNDEPEVTQPTPAGRNSHVSPVFQSLLNRISQGVSR